MISTLSKRLALLQANPEVLAQSLRGIEKEGLRVDLQGRLSTQSHPTALGAALTHPTITTDYSEALLELITGTHNTVGALFGELDQVHRVVATHLGDELLWNHSMPAQLPAEADIPIAWYGTSNTGMIKHVYRRGLAQRYGKTMQCIAGVHYNFSFSEAFWDRLELPQALAKDRRSAGYISLIRNFTRYSWLLMYLFGSSPAVSRGFLRGQTADLQALGDDTLYLPYATSLRMSDLGYQNKAQAGLKLCYNDLTMFLQRLYDAVTTPWPAYEKIGTHQAGQWLQLNANVLQIENEFYSSIRPKRTTGPCERPITALAERGIQYIEVRCLDIDPTEPLGISEQTARFVDAFLLFCALQESPPFADSGWCPESAANFSSAVKQGRAPGLQLSREDKDVALASWAQELLDQIGLCAQTLGGALNDGLYIQAVEAQYEKVVNTACTPSARMLDGLKESGASHQDYALALSSHHAQTLRQRGLSEAEQRLAVQQARQSLADQVALETNDTEGFDEYVARFHRALKAPC